MNYPDPTHNIYTSMTLYHLANSEYNEYGFYVY